MEIREEELGRIKEVLRVSWFCRRADLGMMKTKKPEWQNNFLQCLCFFRGFC